MSDFHATASDTATKLTTLIEEVDRTQASLDSLDGLVASTANDIDTQWISLNSRGETLLSKLNAIREQMNAEVTEVGEALEQLQDKIATARSQVETEFDETKASLDRLETALETATPDLEEVWEATETTLTSLQEQSQEIEAALETSFTEIGTSIADDFVTAMQTHESAIVQQTETLQTYISSECLSQLSTKSSEFSDRLTQVADELSQQLQEVSENTETAVTSSLERAYSEHNSTLENLMATARDVSDALEEVGKTVDETSSNVTRTLALLETATDTTNQGFNTTVDVFVEARELLGRFGMA